MLNNRFALASALSLAFVLSGCSGHDRTPADQLASVTVQARTVVIQPTEVDEVSAAPATVVAQESVNVASRLMGYIKNIAVNEGQSVKTGQRLFTIDPMDIEGAVEQARLGLKQAEDALKDAESDYRRFESLYKDEVVTRQQYDKMKLNYDIALSRAAQAKAGLSTAQGQMRYATVASPIDGIVTRKLANEGDIAAPGHPVLVVENPGRLQVRTTVPEAIFAKLRLGMPVPVEADGVSGQIASRVARLSPAADPVSHSYEVKLDAAAAGLKSGAFARALFPVGKRSALLVPSAAVLERAGITGVFVVDPQGIARYRMVRTGSVTDGQTEILSGLSAGERIVTEKAASVNNGDRIQG